MKRIAVIGAGPSGLTAIKSCKEEGVEVVCFERNGDPGGLWRYHDEDLEGVASVMKTTIINTSKEMSAFSDFPPPREFPNFMHNSYMYKYFMMYAEKNDLLRHIRCHQEVVRVTPSADYERSGRWVVKTKNTVDETVSEEEFDGVMVCIGHHVYPKIPSFAGQEKFKGSIIHTHSLKHCEAYKDQRVVVVGIGNSGVDAAVDCTFTAKQVFLSTRRGSWIYSRVSKNGQPYDVYNNRIMHIKNKFRTFESKCSDLEKLLNERFDHEAYNLKPKHRVFSAHPTVNDALPNCILSGKIIIKGDISRFEENGVVFEGETDVTEVDAVILATGYLVKFPFLNDGIISTEDNRIHLYKYAFPPHLKHPTLAIIALIQPIGPIFPLAEMQSRWFMQLFKGSISLPSTANMQLDVARKNEENARRYVNSTRHTIQVDFISFMDELASLIGAKPNFYKMALTDPVLFWTCMNGPCYPYQYRLVGPHAWVGARDTLLNYKERILAPLNTRHQSGEKGKSVKTYSVLFPWLALSSLALILLSIYWECKK